MTESDQSVDTGSSSIRGCKRPADAVNDHVESMEKGEYKTIEIEPGSVTSICLRRFGAGPTILFLHGWLQSSARWSNIMDSLSNEHTVLALDLPGFGHSAPLNERYLSIGQYTEIVSKVVKEYSLDENLDAIVGDSLGALIALKLIETEKAAPRYLLVSGCPVGGLPLAMKIVGVKGVIRLLLVVLRRMPISIAIFFIKHLSFITLAHSRHIDSVFIQDILLADPTTAEVIFREISRGRAINLHRVGCSISAVVLRGDQDRIVSRTTAQHLAGHLGAAYSEVPRSGHTPILENEIFYTRVLTDLLKDQTGCGNHA